MKEHKMTAGFTLVELIVVIAILGILAGVGTVGYSGYIKKANQAADEQLLSYVNQAYATACLENGMDASSVQGAALAAGTDDKSIGGISGVADKIIESFEKYFADNMNSTLQTCNVSEVQYANGRFYLLGSKIIEALKTAANSIKEALVGSSYAGNEAAIIGDIQSLTNTIEAMAGVLDVDDLKQLLGGSFGDYLTEKGVSYEDSQAVANYATLFVADQVSSLSDTQKEKIAELWASNSFAYTTDVMEGVKLFANPETGLSTMGAMAVFYANAEACVQHMSANYTATTEAEEAQKQAVIAAFNGVATAMGSADGVEDAWTALAEGYQNMIAACGSGEDYNAELANALTGYCSGSNSSVDAEAFLSTMSSINENADSLESMTGSDNMYSSLAGMFGSN